MTFVLKDGDHVIEITMDGFCFYEIITVSGAADLVLFVEDLFRNYYGQWPNVIVLDVGFWAYTSSPLPGSIEYSVYDASKCPGPYYEYESFGNDEFEAYQVCMVVCRCVCVCLYPLSLSRTHTHPPAHTHTHTHTNIQTHCRKPRHTSALMPQSQARILTLVRTLDVVGALESGTC